MARKPAKAISQKSSRATPKKLKPRPSQLRAVEPAGARLNVAREPTRKEEPTPPPAPRKPAFYEALAIYESGVRALQRHDFSAGAESFRGVINRYPDERELVERARLYLQVCERETARRPPQPQSAADSVYAATVALNAGDPERALGYLGKALEAQPDSDHAHYIMAVALIDKGDQTAALKHLRQAITLNPDNRSQAINDPDLDELRDSPDFRDLLGSVADAAARRRLRSRR
jgi:tetratricopeptide (TPR) repeat protein